MATSLLPRLRHSIDVLTFNPPYVPTFSEEAYDAQGTASIQGSWAGGIDGMQVTDTLLQTVGVSAQVIQGFTNGYRLVAGPPIDNGSFLSCGRQGKRYLCDPRENAGNSWAAESSMSTNTFHAYRALRIYRWSYSEERVESTCSYYDSITD